MGAVAKQHCELINNAGIIENQSFAIICRAHRQSDIYGMPAPGFSRFRPASGASIPGLSQRKKPNSPLTGGNRLWHRFPSNSDEFGKLIDSVCYFELRLWRN
jgi:hypothetical protein